MRYLSESGHYPKKIKKITDDLLGLGIFICSEGEAVASNDQREITSLSCRDDDELITRYVEYVQHRLREELGEEYMLSDIRSLLMNTPSTEIKGPDL